MARRRRGRSDLDTAEAVFALIALVCFLSFFSPAVRQTIRTVGFIAALLIGLGLVTAVGVLVYRFIAKRRRLEQEAVPLRVFDLNRLEPEVVVSPPRSASAEVKLKVEGREPVREEISPPELLERLKKIDWFQFEKFVEFTYRKLGYAVTRKGGANPDGGVDLLVEKDGVTSAIQCKQWKTWNVGLSAMREFLGALTDARIPRGIFITLKGYTSDAKAFAEKQGIEILNETGLARMLETTDARFDPAMLEILNDTRKFCPKCEREMVLKTATKGKGEGQQFWACTGYPWKCRYTMPFS
jgi:hypothetical protein